MSRLVSIEALPYNLTNHFGDGQLYPHLFGQRKQRLTCERTFGDHVRFPVEIIERLTRSNHLTETAVTRMT